MPELPTWLVVGATLLGVSGGMCVLALGLDELGIIRQSDYETRSAGPDAADEKAPTPESK